MKTYSLILACTLLVGCAGQQVSSPVKSTAVQERTLYEQGLRQLSRNDYQNAAKSFNGLLNHYPATAWLSGAYYNLGLAEEGLNNYSEAASKYRKVIELNEPSARSKDEAEALYRLSICYEALNDDGKMTFSLLQLLDKKDFLPKQVGDMEVPARLAAAYARQGNLDQAKFYYAKAQDELRRYRRPPLTSDVMVWLPKTLYSMGSLTPLKKDASLKEFREYLNALNEVQPWLVRSAELGNNPWSRKAAETLEDLYLAAVSAIKEYKPSDMSDHLLVEKQKQDVQKRMASLIDEAIAKLKLERLPSTPSDPEAGKLTDAFNTVNDVEKRVTEIVQAHNVQDQDTKEAQAHQGLRQEGRIVDKP